MVVAVQTLGRSERLKFLLRRRRSRTDDEREERREERAAERRDDEVLCAHLASHHRVKSLNMTTADLAELAGSFRSHDERHNDNIPSASRRQVIAPLGVRSGITRTNS
jgi:hypothetical protein